jgi:[ribosomal protein S5]-alanine N-acetyltransferase
MPVFPADLTLRGSGVRLRRLRQADLEEFHRLGQDVEVARWVDPSDFTVEKAQEALDRATELWDAGTGAHFAITAEPEEKLLGTINLHLYDPTRASVGYGVAREARGRGLATRALTLLSSWAFDVAPELVRLELWIVVGNDASVVVAERAGFQREGVFRSRLPFGSEVRDVIVHSRIRGDPQV